MRSPPLTTLALLVSAIALPSGGCAAVEDTEDAAEVDGLDDGLVDGEDVETSSAALTRKCGTSDKQSRYLGEGRVLQVEAWNCIEREGRLVRAQVRFKWSVDRQPLGKEPGKQLQSVRLEPGLLEGRSGTGYAIRLHYREPRICDITGLVEGRREGTFACSTVWVNHQHRHVWTAVSPITIDGGSDEVAWPLVVPGDSPKVAP